MKWIVIILVGVGILLGGVYLWKTRPRFVSPLGQIIERPLDKYTIERLSRRKFAASHIVLDEPSATMSAYTVYPFHFTSDRKTVRGVARVPRGTGPFPVIVQLRGFVDPKKYTPGEGTAHSAEVYAANGFLTVAPDFLGYGGSDMPSTDVFEERFETYTTVLNLIASVKSLPLADASHLFLWGHSNGGQIALTVLEILGKPLPATLWAPVSKPFPYSILYYTDDFDDHGKALRKQLAKFEENYDVELYSLTNYLTKITGPIQIHQGTADESVPEKWSGILAKTLKDERKVATNSAEVNYFTYPGADHNLMPGWDTVVSRDISFFRKYLK